MSEGRIVHRRCLHDLQQEVSRDATCYSSNSPSSLISANINKKLLPVEFRSVLRLRPLNKKKREDHVVLEIPRVNMRQSSDCCFPSIVLRPLPRPPFGSPETASRASNQEMEFHFDQVFGESAAQDCHVFAEIGRPMSLASIEPLFSNHAHRKTHVNIAIGTAGSGKTYMCLGDPGNLKRKDSSNGMLPRMVDSLFGQYQRISSAKQDLLFVQSCYFVLQISGLQVNQPTHPKTPRTSSFEKGKLHDLLLYSTKASSKVLQKSSSSLERHMSGKASSGSGKGSTYESASLRSIEKAVYIDQDPLTHDFHVANAQVRQCRSSEEAREALQDIALGIRKASTRRHESCHVLVQMEPVLVDKKTRKPVRRGGRIAFLDMAGFQDQSISKGNQFGSTQLKDSIGNRCDAHAAVVHCLRSILFNELFRQGRTPTTSHERDATSEFTMETRPTARNTTVRQVPFLQHKITMLLQPFFSPNQSDRTVVTMLIAASPGHRDYMEKKQLFIEIESLWSPLQRPWTQAITGVDTDASIKHVQQGPCLPRKEPPESKNNATACLVRKTLSRGDVERQPHDEVIAIPPPVVPSYSGSSDDFSFPPPMAPPAPSLTPAQDLLRRASAPMEDDGWRYQKVLIPMDRNAITDFPGVSFTGKQTVAVRVDDDNPVMTQQTASPSSALPGIGGAHITHCAGQQTERQRKGSSKTRPLHSAVKKSVKGQSAVHVKHNRSSHRPIDRTIPQAIYGDQPPEKMKRSGLVEGAGTTINITVFSCDNSNSPDLPVHHGQKASPDTVDSDVSSESSHRENEVATKSETEDDKRYNGVLQERLQRLKRLDSSSSRSKSVRWNDNSTNHPNCHNHHHDHNRRLVQRLPSTNEAVSTVSDGVGPHHQCLLPIVPLVGGLSGRGGEGGVRGGWVAQTSGFPLRDPNRVHSSWNRF